MSEGNLKEIECETAIWNPKHYRRRRRSVPEREIWEKKDKGKKKERGRERTSMGVRETFYQTLPGLIQTVTEKNYHKEIYNNN